MNGNYIFLACIHDRHTDDKFLAFKDEERAKGQCWIWMSGFSGIQVNEQYGDWCLFVTESYYAFVEKVEVVS